MFFGVFIDFGGEELWICFRSQFFLGFQDYLVFWSLVIFRVVFFVGFKLEFVLFLVQILLLRGIEGGEKILIELILVLGYVRI